MKILWSFSCFRDPNLLTDNDHPVNPIQAAGVCSEAAGFLPRMFDKRLIDK